MSFWKKLGQTALTSGVEGLVNGAVSAPFNLLSQYMAEQSSSRLMREQASINRANFDYSLSQQSPSAMVTRLTDAGLNPALMYGNGVQGMSQQIHSASPSTLGIPKNSQISHSPVEMAQLENIEADTNKKDEETIALQTENLHREEGILLDLQNKRADLLVKVSQSKLNEKQLERITADISFIDQQIKESEQRIIESTERIEQIKAETRLTTAKADREETKVNWEKEHKNEKGYSVPFESPGTISGLAYGAARNTKRIGSSLVERFRMKTAERVAEFRKNKIQEMRSEKFELDNQFKNNSISERKYNRKMRKLKKDAEEFGIYKDIF